VHKFSEFKLGQSIRDTATGLSGVLTAMAERLDGTHQLHIQPHSEKGDEFKDGYYIDWNSVDITDSVGITNRVHPPIKHNVKLGDTVRDRVTGVTGIATSLSTFFNGCVLVRVVPKARFFGLVRPEDIVTSVTLCDVISNHAVTNNLTTKKEAAKPKPVARNGGPARKAERASY
jgi:hypothetical protein